MLATGRKILLTILASGSMTKIVNACSFIPDPNNLNYDPTAENNFYVGIFIYLSIFLFSAIVLLFFLSGRKNIRFVVTAIISVILMIPLTFVFGVILAGCGDNLVSVISIYFLFLLCLFIFQIVSWIKLRMKSLEKLP